MISACFKRQWPADRLARLKALDREARKAGMVLRARNGGGRTHFLPYISFWRGGSFQSSFWGLEGAEGWLHARRTAE